MFTTKDQGNPRVGGPGLTRNHHGAVARRLRRAAAGAVCAAAVALPFVSAAGAQAATTATFTQLTLKNGWANYGSGTAHAAVANVSGIIHLKGAIKTSGTNEVAFTLPKADRPAALVYVPVDMCGATNGRLIINPSGVVSVDAATDFSNAQCFTSLDGASFAKSAVSYTNLGLQNGWAKYGFGTAGPSVRNISGIVHLRGAIKTAGTNQVAFTLPAAFRPAHTVYIKVDLCGATNGRLIISNVGAATVEAEGNVWSNAQCFTSLDGASFAV